MSHDYIHGSEPYFLDRIDTTTEKTLEVLTEILEVQKNSLTALTALLTMEVEAREQTKQRGHNEAQSELTRIFGEMLTLARRPDIVKDFVAQLQDDLLAQCARGFTVIQDEIHEAAMRKVKERAETDGIKAHEDFDGEKSPFVAILPK